MNIGAEWYWFLLPLLLLLAGGAHLAQGAVNVGLLALALEALLGRAPT